jgi:hypothetical protein
MAEKPPNGSPARVAAFWRSAARSCAAPAARQRGAAWSRRGVDAASDSANAAVLLRAARTWPAARPAGGFARGGVAGFQRVVVVSHRVRSLQVPASLRFSARRRFTSRTACAGRAATGPRSHSGRCRRALHAIAHGWPPSTAVSFEHRPCPCARSGVAALGQPSGRAASACSCCSASSALNGGGRSRAGVVAGSAEGQGLFLAGSAPLGGRQALLIASQRLRRL